MKKGIVLLLTLALSFALFTACGEDKSTSNGTSGSSADMSEAPAYDTALLLKEIDAAVPVNTPKDLDETTLSLLMNVKMENVAAFSGKITALNNNTDRIVVIQAKPGKVDAVKADLEAYRESLIETSANYTEFAGEKIKAENGRVTAKGDYVVLAIVGDADKMLSDGPDAVYTAVDKAIDEAFK